ncbi:MAG: hypothetical protein CBE00_01985 [Planctomycetaceae bacterium TMED240]|nr:MAG: hypothetical protein CBE00_01985 [Planctomycetaceae bacterium TMED240]
MPVHPILHHHAQSVTAIRLGEGLLLYKVHGFERLLHVTSPPASADRQAVASRASSLDTRLGSAHGDQWLCLIVLAVHASQALDPRQVALTLDDPLL